MCFAYVVWRFTSHYMAICTPLLVVAADQLLVVALIARHQLLMRARLYHHPVHQNNYLVSVADGAQSVRDDDGGVATALQQSVQSRLHHSLASRVQRRRGLVQDQDLRVAHDSTGDGDALLLPAGEGHASLPHERIIACGEGHYEVVRVGLLCRGLQHLTGGLLAPIGDVFSNASAEQHRLLPHVADQRAQPVHIELPDVAPVQEHAAASHVVESLNQTDQRALAAARGPHQRHRGARLDAQVQTAVHGAVGARRIAERHIAQLDIAYHCRPFELRTLYLYDRLLRPEL
mmetsp:Transcript_2591/g.6027  ORF Transcript_2591/g.6027 Transcript_2591/m.6027 type:complete len:289 (-) Transcript_2591:968-1834(-)